MAPNSQKKHKIVTIGEIGKHGLIPFLFALVANKNFAPLWYPKYATAKAHRISINRGSGQTNFSSMEDCYSLVKFVSVDGFKTSSTVCISLLYRPASLVLLVDEILRLQTELWKHCLPMIHLPSLISADEVTNQNIGGLEVSRIVIGTLFLIILSHCNYYKLYSSDHTFNGIFIKWVASSFWN